MSYLSHSSTKWNGTWHLILQSYQAVLLIKKNEANYADILNQRWTHLKRLYILLQFQP